jgi:hypothetical protein
MMFGRKLETVQDGIGTITGSRAGIAESSSIPWPAAHKPPEPFIPGGVVTEGRPLGVLEERCYSGVAAGEVLALSRAAAIRTPAPQSSIERRRRLDERLRALGIRV